MRIRGYRAEDHDAVMALAPRLTEGVASWRDRAAVERAVIAWVRASLERHDRQRSPVLVAVRDIEVDGGEPIEGEVVGFVTLGTQRHWSGDDDASIGELVVAPHAEGAGIAGALVHAAERWAVEQGHARITLETGAANATARRLYTRLGYLEEELRLTRELPREATASDATSSDPTRSDATSSDPTRSDATSSDPTRNDATSSDPTRSDAASSDAARSAP